MEPNQILKLTHTLELTEKLFEWLLSFFEDNPVLITLVDSDKCFVADKITEDEASTVDPVGYCILLYIIIVHSIIVIYCRYHHF
jgi:hypothetical protein